MKVSVIVPVYNVYKYLDKCLNSLVNQTLKDIEIIVVNDGTKDNSQDIIDKYVKKYPNKVKSYIKENGGQGSARNFGLKHATGEYIGYVDSDDYIELNMYEEMYNKAKGNDLDIVICNNYVVYENNTREVDEFVNIFEDKKLNAFFGKKAVWNKIYKKELLNDISFRSNKWYEDFDFTFKVLTIANKIDYINKPFYNYLIRSGSTMNNKNIVRNLEIIDAFEEILKNDLHKKEFEILEFLAIDHIYISTMVRIINSDYEDKKNIINKLIKYMNINFKNFKKNKYINTLSLNRKIVYYLMNLKQYWIIKLIFKLKGGIK